MQIRVNKSDPLAVKEQLKRQLRDMISSKQMAAGQGLPSARELGALLGLNRNTVALAYRELAAEGYLRTVVGSGTFVRSDVEPAGTAALKEILDEAFARARSLEFTLDQITDSFYNRLAVHGAAHEINFNLTRKL